MALTAKKALRTTLPLLFLAALLYAVDLGEVAKAFRNVGVRQIGQLFLASFVLILISCVKWKMFLVASGQQPNIFYLMRLYVLGYLVNLISPSTIGGDLARSYQLGKRSGKQLESLSSTVLERFTGLVAMAGMALGAVLVGSSEAKGVELAVYLFCAAVFAASFVIFSHTGANLLHGVSGKLAVFLPTSAKTPYQRFLQKIRGASDFSRRDPGLIVRTLCVSFLFHLCTIWNTKVAAEAVGWGSAPYGGLLVVVPLVLIVSAIPLTPGGIGIQEGAFVFLLQRVGATSEQALAVALLLRAKSIVLGMIGGIVWFGLREKKIKSDERAN